MQARVKWLDHMSFVGESGSGHSVVMDGAPENGGRNLGVRPMEMVLLGMGGCAAFDVVMLLQKSRQNVTSVEVELQAERAEDIPRVFTRINAHFLIKGENLADKQVARAVELTSEKYCSASRMLATSVDITYSYDIVE